MRAALSQVAQIAEGVTGHMISLPQADCPVIRSDSCDGRVLRNNNDLRVAGLLRPSSLTQSNRLAASLMCWALDVLPIGKPAALLTCSASSIFAVSLAFERDGLASDWRLVDPFQLPNSIPTALGTSTARLSPSFRLVAAFGGTGIQVRRALQYGISLLDKGLVDECWVVAAEQNSPVQSRAAERLGMVSRFQDAAGLLRISRWTNEETAPFCLDCGECSSTSWMEGSSEGSHLFPNASQEIFHKIIETIKGAPNTSANSNSLMSSDGAQGKQVIFL